MMYTNDMSPQMRKVALAALAVMALATLQASAQTSSQVILTWQASTLFPADYPGKAMPSPGTPVSVAALVIKNSKIVDTTGAMFTWYVDERFAAEGKGESQVTFTAARPASGFHFIRVEVNAGNETSLGSARIPVAAPKTVIDVPLPNRTAAPGAEVTLTANPFSFNIASINDLEFTWLVNGERREGEVGNLLSLRVGTPPPGSAATITTTVFAKNRNNQLEFSKTAAEIKIEPTPTP